MVSPGGWKIWALVAVLGSLAVIGVSEASLQWQRSRLTAKLASLERRLEPYQNTRYTLAGYTTDRAALKRKITTIDHLSKRRGTVPAGVRLWRAWREEGRPAVSLRMRGSRLDLVLDSQDIRSAVSWAEDAVEEGALKWADVAWHRDRLADQRENPVLMIRGKIVKAESGKGAGE